MISMFRIQKSWACFSHVRIMIKIMSDLKHKLCNQTFICNLTRAFKIIRSFFFVLTLSIVDESLFILCDVNLLASYFLSESAWVCFGVTILVPWNRSKKTTTKKVGACSKMTFNSTMLLSCSSAGGVCLDLYVGTYLSVCAADMITHAS